MGSRPVSRRLRGAPPLDADRATNLGMPGAATTRAAARQLYVPTDFEPFSFRLSWPVSLNKQYRAINLPGRAHPAVLLSREARTWRSRAEVELLEQRVPRHSLAGSLALEIEATPPRAGRDLDNVLKATLDLLKRMRVIYDDRFVDLITIERKVPDGVGGLLLTVRPRR